MSFENCSLVIFGATGGIGAALGRQLAPLGRIGEPEQVASAIRWSRDEALNATADRP